jgi:hypothetical protein
MIATLFLNLTDASPYPRPQMHEFAYQLGLYLSESRLNFNSRRPAPRGLCLCASVSQAPGSYANRMIQLALKEEF